MKKTLFLICACTVLFAVAILCTACSGDVRNVNLSRDSLSSETWLEVEKKEVVKICMDAKVRVWDNAPNTEVLNDSCLKGGDYHVSLKEFDDSLAPYWKWISYGYYEPGHQGYGAGFRLVRNIGNNVKWKYSRRNKK